MIAALLALVVAAQAPTPAPAEPERRTLRLAVYDLSVDGVEPRLGRVVTDALVAELRKLQRVSVVGMEEVRAMLDLEAQKQMTGCSDDSCLAEIADSLGVDGVVIGSLAKIGDESVFGLRRIDQREAKTLGQVSQRLQAADGEEFLAMIGPAVEQLFPELPLRAGQTRGVASELALRVNPPPLPPWVFWTTTAASGLLGASAVAALVVNFVLYGQVLARQEEAMTTPVPAKEISALRGQNDAAALTTIALGATAGAAALVAGGVALLTDWQGYGEE